MNLKTICLALLVFWTLLSCNNSRSQSSSTAKTNQTDTLAPKDFEKLQILYNIFNRSADSLTGDEDLGREVAMESALQCIGTYPSEMYKHGLELNAGRPRPLGTVTTRMITEAEIFGGKGFLDYITKMVKLLDPDSLGTNMEFQLQLGIYTDAFLQTYFPDNPTLRAKKKNRITIFVIPVAKGSFQFKKTDGDDIKAYELGGLQP